MKFDEFDVRFASGANRSHLIERIARIRIHFSTNNVCGNDPIARNNSMISIRLSRREVSSFFQIEHRFPAGSCSRYTARITM